MSIRPKPSPPLAPVAAAGVGVAACAAAGAGLSLASWARLLSENSTEFSLRSPRSFAPAWLGAVPGLLPNRSPSSSRRALADAAANRSPGSLRPVPSASLPPNIDATASEPPPPPLPRPPPLGPAPPSARRRRAGPRRAHRRQRRERIDLGQRQPVGEALAPDI